MEDRSKKMLLVTVASVVCMTLAVGITFRFGENMPNTVKEKPVVEEKSKSSVVVDISREQLNEASEDNLLVVPTKQEENEKVQEIQPDPVKPKEPEPPDPPIAAGQKGEKHNAKDVPEVVRNIPKPPSYENPPRHEKKEPVHEEINDAGQVYVPGFGYVDDSGPNQGGTLDGMYENGNKIGTM